MEKFFEQTMGRAGISAELVFSARLHMQSALYAIARLTVCPSVTRVDQSKTVEVRIMQLSPQSSPMTLVS